MRPEHLVILKHLLDLKRWQWMDRDSIDRMQKQRLAGMLESAYGTSHYRRLMEKNDLTPSDVLEDLQSLPVTWKEDVRGKTDAFLLQGTDKEKLHRSKTSGSTGIPLEICYDVPAFRFRTALMFFTELMAGRSATELCAHISFGRHKPHSLLKFVRLFPKITLSVFDDEAKNLPILKKEKPNMIKSLPSSLTMLAKLNLETPDPLRLKSIYTCAEVLTDETRGLLEDSFSCKVFNQYGTIEVRSIAVECPEQHNMHLIPNSSLVEILDDRGKPMKSGTGDIALTCLHNRTMPFIRYMVGDRASWGKECSCGRDSLVLKSIDGRREDMIILPSGKMRPSISVHPLVVRAREMLCYQLVQERPELFVFRYVPTKKPMDKRLKDIIASRIRRGCMEEEVTIEFEEVDRIEKGRTGKIRTVISKVKTRKGF
jgi:phenylacetate-CoA ligase